MSEAYKAAGVDLALGNDLSKMLYEASKQTWQNRIGKYGEIRAPHDSFSGTRSWGLEPLLEVPEPSKIEFDQDADGIGTKVEVSQRVGTYNTAAYDLFAMTCDDPAARGFEPVIVTTVFDVNKLKEHMRPSMLQLAAGMVEAAQLSGVAVKGGEAAEIGKCVGGYGNPARVLQYNWSATVHAAAHRDRVLTGHEVRPGDSLVALRETGFRSNGL
ncbi:MAG: Phosphoribosylformylglycinamidine cyclo-ligase, partial [Candidatus Saccharibacteria bacterium]|nr:Phosphoribosylformylglycinamidine cyclo-ligase [Candidatus Saccharibacteria bacterium]